MCCTVQKVPGTKKPGVGPGFSNIVCYLSDQGNIALKAPCLSIRGSYANNVVVYAYFLGLALVSSIPSLVWICAGINLSAPAAEYPELQKALILHLPDAEDVIAPIVIR